MSSGIPVLDINLSPADRPALHLVGRVVRIATMVMSISVDFQAETV